MDEFTTKERTRINELYSSDFENATPDDIKLIAKWERAKAIKETLHSAELQAIHDNLQQSMEKETEIAETAKETLLALKEKALERLRVIDNG